MMIYDSESHESCKSGSDGGVFLPSFVEDDEAELWRRFEAGLEGGQAEPQEQGACSFAEDEADEASNIPPKACRLIDDFSSLGFQQREDLLEMVGLLIKQEMRRR